MTVRVRFAPSPTGHLHVGGARTAIFNVLFARHHRGAFVIRVEDTDQARSTRDSEAMVLDDLRWLGLDWDEGPGIGGPHAPYRQSERAGYYTAIAQRLLESGHAYRCFCREEDLEAKRKAAEAAGMPPHYDLTCFRLPVEEVAGRMAANAAFAIRFHVPKEAGAAFDADVTIDDLIRGTVTWKKESLGDFILVRSDGLPVYNFCVVADDHDMEISHVIRAEEHLTNTHRQVLIARALGWDHPQFAHVSLILGPDRTKLSKRHGATSVSAYAAEGFLPEAMVNYLTLLGWSSPDGAEIFSAAAAAESFDLARVNAAPAIFDRQKLEWMNAQYIHSMPLDALLERVRPFVADWIVPDAATTDAWLLDALDLMRGSTHTLAELKDAFRLFFEFAPSLAMTGDAGARSLIEALAADLREHGCPADGEAYHALTARLKSATGLKGKQLFMPLRLALTGADHGPELVRLVPLLEKGSRATGLAPILSPLDRVERVLAAYPSTAAGSPPSNDAG